MATFTIIILMVGLLMVAHQSRLLNDFFRRAAKNQLVQEASNMEIVVRRQRGNPTADASTTNNLISVASSVTQARVLVTDMHGLILQDSENNELAGQAVSPDLLAGTLQTGITQIFDFPSAGTDAVGVAVPWRTGSHITGALIFIKPLAPMARQSATEAAKFMLRASVLAMAVALILSYFLASNITKPLSRMSGVARSISKGDFKQRVEVRSADELGDLAEAMNSMADEISVLVQNLTKEKEKLQILAQQRQNTMSDISHDLRTPITSIKGFIEALQDGIITGEEDTRHTLDIIHDESERLARLIDDLFYLARLEAGDIPPTETEVDLAQVVRSSMDAVRPQVLERQIDLRFSTDDTATAGKAVVAGSSDRLTRAILNLLDNAIKYSPPSGVVQVFLKTQGYVHAEHLASQPQKKGDRAFPDEGSAILTVSDQGPGIPAQDIPRLFERFYKSDKSRSRPKIGAGLGLSIAKLIVEQHNGRLEVASEPERGSTFSVTLPLLGHPQ